MLWKKNKNIITVGDQIIDKSVRLEKYKNGNSIVMGPATPEHEAVRLFIQKPFYQKLVLFLNVLGYNVETSLKVCQTLELYLIYSGLHLSNICLQANRDHTFSKNKR